MPLPAFTNTPPKRNRQVGVVPEPPVSLVFFSAFVELFPALAQALVQPPA